MEDMFIERRIIKKGVKKIKLTTEEIEKASLIHLKNKNNYEYEYYENLILELISRDYSKKYKEYLLSNFKEFIDDLVEFCFHNQYLIDTDGIVMIYELEADNKKQLDQYFNEMLVNESLETFIKDLVKHHEEFTTSDLQGVVQARCMKTKEDENVILNEINKRINKKI